MASYDVVFRARRLLIDGAEVSRCVGVRDGRIVAVDPFDHEPDAARMVELGGDVVLLPGLVDTHVHVNEPGRTEWEGFATATRAAVAGGVTTIVDMPLNSIPPTVDTAALDLKRRSAAGRVHCDVGFWGGAVPGNVARMRGLHGAGVFGFKCFLLHSGVDEFPHVNPAQLEAALHEVSAFGGLVIVHAEDSAVIDQAPACHGERYADFLRSRPRDAENAAITQVIELARSTGASVHILHVSSADAIPVIAAARRDGVSVTAETCPHYLTFCAEEVPDGATQYKCCPPIRESENRERLWAGLADGVVDMVVSDHSPSPPELKHIETGDFGSAWGGVSSLQLSLSAVWTQARSRGHTLGDVVHWMAERPAEVARIRHKGRIEVGYDADFVAFAPDETFVVDPAELHHRHSLTPYAGRTLSGVVRRSWLRGRDTAERPHGRLLSRGDP